MTEKRKNYCITKRCDCSDCDFNPKHKEDGENACDIMFEAFNIGYAKALADFMIPDMRKEINKWQSL